MSRKFISSLVFFTVIAFGMMGYMLGCASTPHQRAAKTQSDMYSTQIEFLKTKSQIDATMTTLNGLSQPESTDLPKQYKELVKGINGVESQFNKALKGVDKVHKQSQAYFQEWEKEIESIMNPDIKKSSEERRSTLLESYNKISSTIQPAKEVHITFLSDLRDIETFLKVDLTPKGIASISDVISKSQADAITVNERIDAVITELDRVAAEMPSK